VFLGLFTGRQREDDFQLIDYLGLGVGETGRRQAEVREAALTYWAKCGWALEPQETISNNGENPLLRHLKWAQMVCALGLGEPGTVGIRQAQKRLLELFCCFSQVDGTPALILLEKDSAKSCG